MDRWFDEDDPIYAHPRDPYHRVDVRSSSRHIVVRHRGRVVAESTRPKLLFETGNPTRLSVLGRRRAASGTSSRHSSPPSSRHRRDWSCRRREPGGDRGVRQRRRGTLPPAEFFDPPALAAARAALPLEVTEELR